MNKIWMKFAFLFIIAIVIHSCNKENLVESQSVPIEDNVLVGTWQTDVNGQVWIYRIGYQENGYISGAKLIDTLIIPLTGEYNVSTREIKIKEYNVIDSLCGIFKGNINAEVNLIEGTWTSFKNNTLSMSIVRMDTNYNRIILSQSGNVFAYFQLSEAFYHGSFGLLTPDSMEICDDYKKYIGDTLLVGEYNIGTELIFYIHVFNTGLTYSSFNYDHAIVVRKAPNEWIVKWEDSENIDRDFNDLILKIFIDQIGRK